MATSTPITKHGGKRPGAGRPPTVGASARITITLAPADLATLQSIDSNLSAAVRILIAAHRAA